VKEEAKRKLACPETLLTIRAEQLLSRAGLSLSSQDGSIPPAWWNFSSSSLKGGDERGQKKGILLVSVYDKTASSSSGVNPVKN